MAHFYGRICGNRGAATRCGSSSYESMAQGWLGGIETYLHRDDEGVDHFVVFITGGGIGYGKIQLATGVLDYRSIIEGEAYVQLNDDLCIKHSLIRAREIMTEGVPDYASIVANQTRPMADRAEACAACEPLADRGGRTGA